MTHTGPPRALSFGLVPCDTAILLFDRYNAAVQLYYEAVQIMIAHRDEESSRDVTLAVEEAERACELAFDELKRHRVEHGC